MEQNTAQQIDELVAVEWNSARVLTTAQLAEFYECEPEKIKLNFNRNRNRFVAGKHFFKLEGDALKSLRVSFGYLQISPKTRALYLWTKRGAARHAKMLSTNSAWEVFELLEDSYFDQQAASLQDDDTRAILLEILDAVNSAPDAREILSELAQALKQFAQTEQKIGEILAKMIFALKDSSTKERIAVMATNLIVGEKVF